MDMSMDMPMPSATSMSMTMPMPTLTSSDPMSGMMSGMMDMSQMYMTFFSATNTALFSKDWIPATPGQYAGTCIFLIILSLVLRGLFAFKSLLERRWLLQSLRRRYVKVVTEASPESAVTSALESVQSKTATLTTNGVDEKVKLIGPENLVLGGTWARPWRLSVDLPRATLVTIMVGVGYLL